MATTQDQAFADFEGDNWFKRNRKALECWDPTKDLPLRVIELYQLRPASVLEIGAANGFRLEEIRKRWGSRVVAVDPSAEAIRDGAKRFPSVEFHRGRAAAVPLREHFELIVVNHVFHWIERASLIASVAEVDRLLVDGGFLVIGDFCPAVPTKVRYHHLLGEHVYTFKQDYASLFLSSGVYRSICVITAEHTQKTLTAHVREQNRIGAWLLQKSLEDTYVERSLE